MEKSLNLYNTESREKEVFKPTNENKVGMYCCGPTVYNYAHIGNLRSYLFEDILKRVLLSLDYDLNHIVNITDVGHLTSDADDGDDKMEQGAQREGKTVWEIADHYTEKFMENIADLNILDADKWPKATDHIQEMIDMVQELIDKGFTYTTDDGIYFDTAKFPSYADFAKLDIESLQAGSRIEMGDKKSKTDFALWKFSPKDQKRAMEWDSPWGVGFPGWHIECSAMSLKYLPQPLDIHCGGIDHIRIHHTNEIAQVEASTGSKYCRHWVHGEFLVMDTGKMSKSKGGFITLDTLKEAKVDPLAYRYFIFSAHYRTQLTFSWEGIESAATGLKNLRSLVKKECSENSDGVSPERIDEVLEKFWSSVYDDLNMPQAVASIWELLHNKSFSAEEKRAAVEKAENILALDLFRVEEDNQKTLAEYEGIVIVSSSDIADELSEKILSMAVNRKKARAEKDWATADKMRDDLTALGVTIKDLPDGGTECLV